MGTYLHIAYEVFDRQIGGWKHLYNNSKMFDGAPVEGHSYYTTYKLYPLHFFFHLLSGGIDYLVAGTSDVFREGSLEELTHPSRHFNITPETREAMSAIDTIHFATLEAIRDRIADIDRRYALHKDEDVWGWARVREALHDPEVARYRLRVFGDLQRRYAGKLKEVTIFWGFS